MSFQAYGRPLVDVLDFKYLGRVMTASDDNWPTLVGNLKKARKRWERMYMILGQEGADPRTSENFYKAVVQVTLLFGAGSWVMYPWIGRILFGFHRRVAFRMEKYRQRLLGRPGGPIHL